MKTTDAPYFETSDRAKFAIKTDAELHQAALDLMDNIEEAYKQTRLVKRIRIVYREDEPA